MREHDAKIETPDGVLDAFITHPEEGGPHPAVILYMDAPGIREELRDMARRIGTMGYYAVLPNLYYRDGTEGNYSFDPAKMHEDESQFKKMFAVMNTLSNDIVVADTRPLLDYIRADENAKDGPVGCTGYCMSGRFVTSVASAYPDDFAAIASFYGVDIITKEDDSPHLKADKIKGELYLAFAAEDPYVPQKALDMMEGAFKDNKCRVEIYPGTEHGFAFPQRPAYHKAGAERHWERLCDLFARNL